MKTLIKANDSIEIYSYTDVEESDFREYIVTTEYGEKLFLLPFEDFLESITPVITIEVNDVINAEEFESIYNFLIDNYEYDHVYSNGKEVKR